jgi:hypothetical protein
VLGPALSFVWHACHIQKTNNNNMKLKTALNKSKQVLVLIQLNITDTAQLKISKAQALTILEGYLDLKDEFQDGRFEDNNIIAEYEPKLGTLWIG